MRSIINFKEYNVHTYTYNEGEEKIFRNKNTHMIRTTRTIKCVWLIVCIVCISFYACCNTKHS